MEIIQLNEANSFKDELLFWIVVGFQVMGRDRFVVAYTPNSLIVADMITEKSSEVTWQSAGNERFFFDNENVCLIVNAGEVSRTFC